MADSRCFIIDPWTGDEFEFQNAPASVKERVSTNVKTVIIPGESSPRVDSVGGGARTISFAVDFYAEDEDVRNTEWVISRVTWLTSLKYARVVNERLGTRKVTPVFLILGSLMELPVFVKSIDVTWGPFQDADLLPVLARVKLDMIEVVNPGDFIDAVGARQGKARFRFWEVKDSSGATMSVFNFDGLSITSL